MNNLLYFYCLQFSKKYKKNLTRKHVELHEKKKSVFIGEFSCYIGTNFFLFNSPQWMLMEELKCSWKDNYCCLRKKIQKKVTKQFSELFIADNDF